ncbi:MAG: thiamine pyrophosphate-dependent enzyme [Thermoleophilia bacterium]|nr:thiamine pyrophosphate-dependent enzyme [Thermoleophilia bacterium]MDH4346727.1 thiamine pyrophosphate-dependent enzyme [Thermoleophilia bacterium]MDH5333895.1 thiamine pyrophosphate-dependent enzyme [Thermoleophilia bacterium]
MAEWLEEIVAEEKLLHPGHAACAGCGPAINVRHVLDGLAAARPESRIVLVVPASCWTIIAGIWPVNAFGVSVHLTPFASAAAEASGIKSALRLRGQGDTQVVVWAGDGSTCDIGLSGVSAAAERDEDLVYVLNDNEAYMNTGVQKSGATPEGAWTTTTPATAPRAGQKKDIARIMAAHGIPYVATLAPGSVPMLRDFRAKVARAAEVRGFRFLHVLGACPPGWRYPTDQTVEVTRLAVESRAFPLVACDDGAWRITYRPKRPVPVREYLEAQGRFGHLSPDDVEAFQSHVDERWRQLVALEGQTSCSETPPSTISV